MQNIFASEYMDIVHTERCHIVLEPISYMPVVTSWEFGDKVGIWFAQQSQNTFHFLEYIELEWIYIDDLIKTISSMRYEYQPYMKNSIAKYLPYHYASKTIKGSYGLGKTIYSQALQHGFRFTCVKEENPVNDIHCIKGILRQSIFSTLCDYALEAIMRYDDKESWSVLPVRALRHFAVGHYKPQEKKHNYTLPRNSFAWHVRENKRRRYNR